MHQAVLPHTFILCILHTMHVGLLACGRQYDDLLGQCNMYGKCTFNNPLNYGSLHSQEARVKPDAAVWNALIAAAGRAGQLQRALEALQDMQVCFWWSVHHMGLYSSLYATHTLHGDSAAPLV